MSDRPRPVMYIVDVPDRDNPNNLWGLRFLTATPDYDEMIKVAEAEKEATVRVASRIDSALYAMWHSPHWVMA